MPSLEIHPLSEFRGQAARLLAARYRAQQTAEPLLPDVEDFHAHVPEGGHVATRGAEAVAYLAGAVDEERRMARWLFAGHAATEVEALADLFALQAEQFGVSRFMLTVPATSRDLVDAWFRLGFGCQAVWAVREVEPLPRVEFEGSIRLATEEDAEPIADLDDALHAHQQASPSFSEVTPLPRRERIREAIDLLGRPETYTIFAAERGRRVVGVLVLYRRPEGDLRVPERNIDLSFAATRDDVRGTGVGLALTAHAFNWACERGFRSMTVDWRSVNLLSSRFWPRRGFRPQYLRLYRAVP
jgi:GNAT superfamily N-acetyltransferase